LSAQPLFDFMGVPGAVRASFSLYNKRQEADLLADTVEQCIRRGRRR
jgi:selenocysteine lyase/cysteine desulfurase